MPKCNFRWQVLEMRLKSAGDQQTAPDADAASRASHSISRACRWLSYSFTWKENWNLLYFFQASKVKEENRQAWKMRAGSSWSGIRTSHLTASQWFESVRLVRSVDLVVSCFVEERLCDQFLLGREEPIVFLINECGTHWGTALFCAVFAY